MPSYRARWILPVDSRPVPDGLLTIEGDRIVAIGHGPSHEDTVDLGNSVLLPGLVNAHTHLEYSERETPIGRPGIPLVDWIAAVVAWKRERDANPAEGLQRRNQAIRRGLAESHRWGVTSVGEIATSPWSREPYSAGNGTGIAFLEVLGLARTHLNERVAAVEQFLGTRHRAYRGLVHGISPHAPYTVNLHLLSEICRQSAKRRFPVAMHLAESADELQLLATGDGPFVDLLVSLDAWDATAFAPRQRPRRYLDQLRRAHRVLIIHGNYLQHDEIRLVAEHADRLSIVFCPRTHTYFGHPRYPLAEMLGAGINVALGTDSRASNPDLSLLEEMRCVATCCPEVGWEQVIRLGTLAGAHALGIGDEVGSLTPGKTADFVVVSLPDAPGIGPEVLLEDPRCSVTHVFKSGRQLSIRPNS